MKNRSTAERPWKGHLTLLLNNKPLRWHLNDKSLCPIAASNNEMAKEPVFWVLSAGSRGVDDREEVQEVNNRRRLCPNDLTVVDSCEPIGHTIYSQVQQRARAISVGQMDTSIPCL
jgi:hypothetical protein